MLVGLVLAIREKGLAQTQVTDIVRHAGASRRTFYRYFADKDACFIALAESLFELVRSEVEAAIDPAAPWESQIDAAIDVYLSIIEADPPLASAFRHHLPALGERGLQIERDTMDRYAEMVIRLSSTDQMRRSGVAAATPALALMLIGGIDAVVGRAIAADEPIGELGPAIKDLFKRSLRPA
ncbi:MAG: TetR/AcrR family transcriptional regulator [Solirubrobacteraceae bacterium]|nr:TetR/AcrR family transcriptional regulator [Solirubrobacteraceae bacterium]